MKVAIFVYIMISIAESFVVNEHIVVGRMGRRDCTGKVTVSFASFPKYAGLKATDNDENGAENKLNSLGYSKQEIQRSLKSGDKEEIKVQVNLLPEIDSVTLTAVGFALIAFNFFVLANLEDGGIAGLVASVINLSRQ